MWASRDRIMTTRWCAALATAVAGMLADSVAASDTAVEAVIARWQRISTFEAHMRAYPLAHRVPKEGDDAMWDRSAWEHGDDADFYDGARGREREVIAHFHSGEFDLAFDTGGDLDKREHMSLISDEFIDAFGLFGERPHAQILPPLEAMRLGFDKLLTVFEHQFFDERMDWPTILETARFRTAANGEVIGGESCCRLEGHVTHGGRDHDFVIWVAPRLDYAPVRAKCTSRLGDEVQSVWEMRVLDHIAVGPSWLAKTALIALSKSSNDYHQMSAFEVVSVNVGPEYGPTSVRELFPEGTSVKDLVAGEVWIADGTGGRKDVKPINMEEYKKAVKSLSAQIRTPKMTQERNSVLLTILLIALLAAAGLVLARRWIQRAG